MRGRRGGGGTRAPPYPHRPPRTDVQHQVDARDAVGPKLVPQARRDGLRGDAARAREREAHAVARRQVERVHRRRPARRARGGIDDRARGGQRGAGADGVGVGARNAERRRDLRAGVARRHLEPVPPAAAPELDRAPHSA